MAQQLQAPKPCSNLSPAKATSATVKIYYLHSRMAGPLAGWDHHLERIRSMGFSHVCLPPLFAPDRNGDVLLSDCHDVTDPVLGIDGSPADAIAAARKRLDKFGLGLLADVVLDRVARDGETAREFPAYFASDSHTCLDPRQLPTLAHASLTRFGEAGIADWWGERLGRMADAGLAGVRVLGLERVPARSLSDIVAETRRHAPACWFLGWTPGLSRQQLMALRGGGLDGVFASTAWWDVRASWYVEEHNALRSVAPVLGIVEAPNARRLGAHIDYPGRRLALHRRTLHLAAATGSGFLMPMGYELMARERVDARFSDPVDFTDIVKDSEGDLSSEIAVSCALVDELAQRGPGDDWRTLTGPLSPVAVLRSQTRRVSLYVNSNLDQPAAPPKGLPSSTSCAKLAAAELKVSPFRSDTPILGSAGRPFQNAKIAAKAPRIVIDNITPCIDGGTFAAKRILGELITVEADVFTDGHEELAVEVLWQAADEKPWQRLPMTAIGNDRWRATLSLPRVGRWFFAIEAWLDELATVRRAKHLKQDAGQDVSVELEEEKRFLAAGEHRAFATRSQPLPIEAERPAAGFASWYELFPRSLTGDPRRHGTFDDVIANLPRIRDMGFDVLYFPPIHPIGRKARKGRNNALLAEADDVGSPYAIGSSEGGHDAILPALGTLEDFRRLVAAAGAHGLEIALDFAIQCSPDHPWLRQHPNWFRRRPDGTIKYAENPPKKYEDIVNVDFYAEGAVPDLWEALRDVVQFWVDNGVRTFRVDNPHTKPLPFWQWLIDDIRGHHPDVIFLSEAFTRPTMMYRLAKVGFSQSYTYFTWRNTRRELSDYLTEITRTPVVDFFRPHFFVNTPDINPYFLQTSGRAGFLIRAALAATLSGLWGVYSGFEICEAAPLPGREEYLDSEKYEIRVRDFDAPGNIVAEIIALNRIRRANPALHSHRGVNFYSCDNEQVLVYGKALPSHEDMIFVAVSLDPHHAQEAAFEIPLWEWRLPDSGTLNVEDLMSGTKWAWHGKHQRVRLDPAGLPFAIWRLWSDGGAPA
jgi:starch synthase (maltosyl-transferring)